MLQLSLLTLALAQEPPPPDPTEDHALQASADDDARRGAEAGLADAKLATRPFKPMVLGATAGACLGLSGCLTPCIGPACVLPTAVLGPPAVAFAQRPAIPPQTMAALAFETQDYQIGYQVAYGLETRRRRSLQTGAGALAGTAVGAAVGVVIYMAVLGVSPWQRWG